MAGKTKLGLMTMQEVLAVVPTSSTTLLRMVRDGGFPRPVEILGIKNRYVWRISDIEKWQDKLRATKRPVKNWSHGKKPQKK